MSLKTVNSITIPEWIKGNTVSLRKTPVNTFIDSDGFVVLKDAYVDIACSVVGNTLTIPAFQLRTTTDSDTPNSQYQFHFVDGQGNFLQIYYDRIKVPHTIVGNVSWGQLTEYTKSHRAVLDDTYYTALQIDYKLSTLPVGGGSGFSSVKSLKNDYSSDLGAAITGIGSTPTTLAIDADITITDGKVIPANIEFLRINQSKITISGAGSIRFMGKGIKGDEDGLFVTTPAPDFLWAGYGASDTFPYTNHGFITGQQCIVYAYRYGAGGGAVSTVSGGLVDEGVYYVIRIDNDHFQLASSYQNAISLIPITITSGTTGNGMLVHHCPVHFSGTTCPPTISSEIFDTGNNSESARVNLCTRALTGSGCVIDVAPRTIYGGMFIADGHNIRLLRGTHVNMHDGTTGSQNHWGYQPFSYSFVLWKDSILTSEKGAICEQSQVDYCNGLAITEMRSSNCWIVGNYFKQNRQATATGSASPITICGGHDNHILDNIAEDLKCYVFSINPIRPGIDDPTHCSCKRNTVKDTLTQVFFIGGGDDVDFSDNLLDCRDHILHISTTRIATTTNIIGVPNGTLDASLNLGWAYSSSGDAGRRVTAVGANDSYSSGYQAVTLDGITSVADTQACNFDNIVACSTFDIEPNGPSKLQNIRIENNTFDVRGLNNSQGGIYGFIRFNPAGVDDPKNVRIRNNRIIGSYKDEIAPDGRYLLVDAIGVDNLDISGNMVEGLSYAAYMVQLSYCRRARVYNNTALNGAAGVWLKNSQDTEVFGQRYLSTPDYAYGTNPEGRIAQNISEAGYLADWHISSALQYIIGSYPDANNFQLLYQYGGVDGGYVFKHFLQSLVYINDSPYTITAIDNTGYPKVTVTPALSATPQLHITTTLKTKTFTDSNVLISPTNEISITGHGFVDNELVYLSNAGGALPSPFAINTPYYVIVIDANTIKLSATSGGAAITITSASGGGTNTIYSNEVDIANNSIHATGHGYVTGAAIQYLTGGGNGIIADFGQPLYGSFFVIRVDADNFKLARSYEYAKQGIPIDFAAVPASSQEFYTAAVAFSTNNHFHDNHTTGQQIRLPYDRSTSLVSEGTVTIDPASVGANSESSQTFTLMGARVGDKLTLNPPAAGLTAGLLVGQCFVSASDTITIKFYNITGSPIDQASGTWDYTLKRV